MNYNDLPPHPESRAGVTAGKAYVDLQELLSAAIRAGMAQREWSIRELATRVGITSNTIGKMLAGQIDGKVNNWQKLIDEVGAQFTWRTSRVEVDPKDLGQTRERASVPGPVDRAEQRVYLYCGKACRIVAHNPLSATPGSVVCEHCGTVRRFAVA